MRVCEVTCRASRVVSSITTDKPILFRGVLEEHDLTFTAVAGSKELVSYV